MHTGAGTRRRVRAPDRRRDDLLEAATRLLLARGIESTSVADITREAGVAKGTFYLYFASRDELLDALRGQLVDAAVERLTQLRPPPTREGWPAYLDALTDETISLFTEHAALHGLLAGTAHDHAPTSGEGLAIQGLIDTLAAVIARGIEARAVVVSEPTIAAALMLDLLHSAVHQTLAAPNDTDRVRQTARTMVRGSLLDEGHSAS